MPCGIHVAHRGEFLRRMQSCPYHDDRCGILAADDDEHLGIGAHLWAAWFFSTAAYWALCYHLAPGVEPLVQRHAAGLGDHLKRLAGGLRGHVVHFVAAGRRLLPAAASAA